MKKPRESFHPLVDTDLTCEDIERDIEEAERLIKDLSGKNW